MRDERDGLLIDDEVDAESERARSMPGWARVMVVAGGAALGLAGFTGVGYAATPDADAVNGLGLDGGSAFDGTIALRYGAIDDAAVYDRNGGESSPKTAKSSKTVNTVSPQTVTTNTVSPQTVTTNTVSPNTVSPQTVTTNTVSPQTVSPDTVSPETASPNTVSPQTVTPSPITDGTLEQNGGLQLGQLFHDGQLPHHRAADLATQIGLEGVDAGDLQQMSLGELLRTAHAGGLSTQDVADILNGE